MKTNLKFHAIAITIIVVVVSTLYIATGPKTASQNQPADTSGKSIEIYSATWGQQCNPYITEALESPIANAQDEAGNPLPTERLKPVEPNNVLPAIKTACAGKTSCNLQASIEALGDPMHSCFKRLTVGYRCYSFDRLRTLDIGQGEYLKIDCLAPQTPDATTSPEAQ